MVPHQKYYHYWSAKSRGVLTGYYGVAENTKNVLLSRDSGIRKMGVLGFFETKTPSLLVQWKGEPHTCNRVCLCYVWRCWSVLLRLLLRAVYGREHPCNTLRFGVVSTCSVLPADVQNGGMTMHVMSKYLDCFTRELRD